MIRVSGSDPRRMMGPRPGNRKTRRPTVREDASLREETHARGLLVRESRWDPTGHKAGGNCVFSRFYGTESREDEVPIRDLVCSRRVAEWPPPSRMGQKSPQQDQCSSRATARGSHNHRPRSKQRGTHRTASVLISPRGSVFPPPHPEVSALASSLQLPHASYSVSPRDSHPTH